MANPNQAEAKINLTQKRRALGQFGQPKADKRTSPFGLRGHVDLMTRSAEECMRSADVKTSLGDVRNVEMHSSLLGTRSGLYGPPRSAREVSREQRDLEEK
ncbi:hypothetical protein V8E52_004528 [Russula decolorans]